MLELLVCSMVTILPDYLYRRYVQGKRFGKEITLYTVWYELRYGITLCLLLTISLITVVFYYHPSSTSVAAVFRTVTILPEGAGRVAEVFVANNQKVEAGAPLFRLDSSAQEAAVKEAERNVAEVQAEIVVTETELAAADGMIQQAESAYQQALDELNTKTILFEKDSGTVSERDIEQLTVALAGRDGARAAAIANKETLKAKISTLLPARLASAEAALASAHVELEKTLVTAAVAGTVTQFALRPGDVVNPLLRPAGILIPANAGGEALLAGFNQIEADIMKVGMVGEVACSARPFTIIPVVVTQIQTAIAGGQFRPTDQLIDPTQVAQPGSITVFLEALYPGQLDDIPLGATCIANAYTSNHERLATEDLGTMKRIFLHAVDTVGLVHALILRIHAALLPVQTLVLTGGGGH